MFLPYKVDVPMHRYPWANWGLIALTCVVSLGVMFAPDDPTDSGFSFVAHIPAALKPWVLFHHGENFHITGLVSNLFVHADLVHLLGNMFFLWLFGNAVNAKVGHLPYLGLYLLAGVAANAAWLLLGSGEVTLLGLDVGLVRYSLGASGAIMGIIGMFLWLYPHNNVSVLWGYSLAMQTSEISAYWIIALYLAFDIWGIIRGTGGVAYQAHVGGLVFGSVAMAGLLWYGFFAPDRNERNLLQMLGWQDDEGKLRRAKPTEPVAGPVGRFVVEGRDRVTGMSMKLTLRATSAAEAQTQAAGHGVVAVRVQQIS